MSRSDRIMADSSNQPAKGRSHGIELLRGEWRPKFFLNMIPRQDFLTSRATMFEA